LKSKFINTQIDNITISLKNFWSRRRFPRGWRRGAAATGADRRVDGRGEHRR